MRVAGEDRGEVFQDGGDGVQFLHKNKLKPEIFNENKSLLTKMYMMGWGIRIKEIAYYGGSLKNLIFGVESQKRNI